MSKTLKLLYATCFLDVSGVTQINFEILAALADRWEIHPCVTERDHQLPANCDERFATRFREPLKLWRIPPSDRYATFLHYLKRHEIDLIYVTHSLWLYQHAARLKCDLPSLRIVDSLHVLEPYCFRGGYPDISGNRFVHRYIDRSILISQHLRQYLLRNYPVDPRKLVVIHNGIDEGRFKSNDAERKRIRNELGAAAGDKLVGFIGRLTLQKRPLLVVDTARWLCRRDPGLSVYLVGDGPLRPKVQERIARYGLSERIHLLGTRDDVPALLAASDLLLLPSAYEGAPLTILEALAVGVPVVASDVGAVREYVDERCCLVPLGRGGSAEREAYVAAVSATLELDKGAGGLRAEHRLSNVANRYRFVFEETLRGKEPSQPPSR